MPDNKKMDKHWVKWKTLRTKNIYGEPIDMEFPYLIDICYEGSLISKILRMPKKTAIAFEHAVRLAERQYCNSDISTEIEKMNWCTNNFIDFISEQGYHIELTGDEFELPYQSNFAN